MSNNTRKGSLAVASSEAVVRNTALERFVAGLTGAFEAALERRRQRMAVRDLQRLSDYELRDIGLTRGDIEWAVAESRHGDPHKAIEEVRRHRADERNTALSYAVGDPRRLPLVD